MAKNGKSKKKATAKEDRWAEAKRKCRLNAETVRMAKELGLNPLSLIKNIPNPRQQWKAPVAEWVRRMYEKRFGKAAAKPPRDESRPANYRFPADSKAAPIDPKPPGPPDMRTFRLPAPGASEGPPLDPWLGDLGYPVEAGDDPNNGFAHLDDEGLDDDAFADEGLDDDGALVSEWDDDGDGRPDRPPGKKAVREQNAFMLRRQREFRTAAEWVARELANVPVVTKVALIGSVAVPLKKEVPRFREFRRAGIEVWHECNDVDVAVWVTDTSDLKRLHKARSRALNELLTLRRIGVAHHQVDMFLLEPDTDRYLGRLCHFSTCPKQGKVECQVPGCGASPFLQQHANFTFHPDALAPPRMEVLFDRSSGGESTERDSEVPF